MFNSIPVCGIDYMHTTYLPSKDIISLVDLIKFVKSDSCAKIAYMVLDLKCGMYFYPGTKGTVYDNSESVLLLKISVHRENLRSYIEYANSLFFIKEDIGNIIKNEPWITFNRETSTEESSDLNIHDSIMGSIKKTAFFLTKYYNKIGFQDIKFEFTRWCFGYDYDFMDRLNNELSDMDDISTASSNVPHLKDYTPSMTGHIDYFEEAKRYAKNNIPSTEFDEINLICDIKEKFKLTHRKIASIVFEHEWSDTAAEALTKRVQRALKKNTPLASR
jgi:hypothetical protein